MVHESEDDDDSSDDGDSNDDGPVEWASYWKPNITINLVADFTQYVSWNSFNLLAHFLTICPTFCLT